MVEKYIDYFKNQVQEMYSFLVGTNEEVIAFDESHHATQEPIILTFRKFQAPIDNRKINQPLMVYVEVLEDLKDDVYKVLCEVCKSLNETIVPITLEDVDGNETTIEVTQNFNMPYLVSAHLDGGSTYKTLYGIDCTLSYAINSNFVLSNEIRLSINDVEIPNDCILNLSFQEAVVTEGVNESLVQKNMPIALKHSITLSLYIKKDYPIVQSLIAPSGNRASDLPKFDVSLFDGTSTFTDKVYRSSLTISAVIGAYISCQLTLDTRWWD